jgi:hypothetical protein
MLTKTRQQAGQEPSLHLTPQMVAIRIGKSALVFPSKAIKAAAIYTKLLTFVTYSTYAAFKYFAFQ